VNGLLRFGMVEGSEVKEGERRRRKEKRFCSLERRKKRKEGPTDFLLLITAAYPLPPRSLKWTVLTSRRGEGVGVGEAEERRRVLEPQEKEDEKRRKKRRKLRKKLARPVVDNVRRCRSRKVEGWEAATYVESERSEEEEGVEEEKGDLEGLTLKGSERGRRIGRSAEERRQ